MRATISATTISKIIELTALGKTRPAIAEELGIGAKTVWRYQKKFDLV